MDGCYSGCWLFFAAVASAIAALIWGKDTAFWVFFGVLFFALFMAAMDRP